MIFSQIPFFSADPQPQAGTLLAVDRHAPIVRCQSFWQGCRPNGKR